MHVKERTRGTWIGGRYRSGTWRGQRNWKISLRPSYTCISAFTESSTFIIPRHRHKGAFLCIFAKEEELAQKTGTVQFLSRFVGSWIPLLALREENESNLGKTTMSTSVRAIDRVYICVQGFLVELSVKNWSSMNFYIRNALRWE